MKKITLIIIISIVFIGLLIFLNKNFLNKSTSPSSVSVTKEPLNNTKSDIPLQSTIATNLDTPWSIAFLPSGNFLATERRGDIWLIEQGNDKTVSLVGNIKNSREIGEGGLLGITIDPSFSDNNFIYLYYTYQQNGDNTLNRVSRLVFKDNKLSLEKIIVDNIPGASNHNGGRIKFGPDGNLYIGTGDAGNPSQAQDKNLLAGKILRVTSEGKVALGNPFNNLVYSYGHRNVQGLAWDTNGNLWATEHGRSGVLSGLDELNLIEIGKNYGWPDIEGYKTKSRMETPKRNSGSSTWAPSGATFLGNSVFFAGLRGQALYQAVIENGKVLEIKEHFKNELGRIRDVVLGPDGLLYITTSNLDGRGNPTDGDDKIIKVNASKL